LNKNVLFIFNNYHLVQNTNAGSSLTLEKNFTLETLTLGTISRL